MSAEPRVTILPFRAIRFNPERVRLADVVTQPYDKIDRVMQRAYHERSPYNIAHIIKSREVDEQGEKGYVLAGELWRRWLQTGTLIRQEQPAYFVYRRKFALD